MDRKLRPDHDHGAPAPGNLSRRRGKVLQWSDRSCVSLESSAFTRGGGSLFAPATRRDGNRVAGGLRTGRSGGRYSDGSEGTGERNDHWGTTGWFLGTPG